MPRLLILLTLPGNVRDYYAARLKKRFPELEIDIADHFSKATPLAPNADILLTFGPMMRDEVFANAPKLKWVQALGTGVDGVIDQPSLGKHVTVTNIRGIHGAPVSEAAIMGMLALSRDLPRSVRCQDQNSWTRWPPKLLDNKTVGIYGIGLIAEALAPRCKAFGMTVVGYSSTKREVPGIDRMLLRSDLIATAKELDYLVLLVPYSEETRHSIGAKVFAAMKPTAYPDQSRARRDRGRGRHDRGAQRRQDRGRGARRIPDRAAAAGLIRCGRRRTSSSRRISAASATSMPIWRW